MSLSNSGSKRSVRAVSVHDCLVATFFFSNILCINVIKYFGFRVQRGEMSHFFTLDYLLQN